MNEYLRSEAADLPRGKRQRRLGYPMVGPMELLETVAPNPTQSGGTMRELRLGVAVHSGPRGDSGMFPVGVGGTD